MFLRKSRFSSKDLAARARPGLPLLGAIALALSAIAACTAAPRFPAIGSTAVDAAGPAAARADASVRNVVPSVPDAARPDVVGCQDPICCVGPGCPKRPAGAPCQTADQCATGSCADGVCCNVACRGACVSCNQADRMGECLRTPVGQPDPHLLCRTDRPESCGQSGVCNGQGGCAKYNAGVLCGYPACDGSQAMVPASECDGEGTCVTGTPIACAPFQCEGSSCRVTCTQDGQCQSPQVCINGSCGKRGRGQNCTDASQCESGSCADGVCCDSACTGKCTTCAAPASRGRCVPVAAGTPDPRFARGIKDPALVCLDLGAASCGSNGQCDGRGGCATYAAGTTCGPGECEGSKNLESGPTVCRAGRCERGETRTCAPFLGCDGIRCSTRCASDRECVAGTVCLNGSCGKRPVGSVCSQDSECAAPGVCAQGRCCSTTCNQKCMACNLEGSHGTCAPVALGGADPVGTCRNDACNNGCDGKGNCQRERQGTVCGAGACMGDRSVSTRTCSPGGLCPLATSPCPAGQTCQKDRCAAPLKRALGETCVDPDDCVSGACVAGHCCAGSCSGLCRTCTGASAWRCVDRPEESDCGSNQICRIGRCVSRCGMNSAACGTTCVHLATDPDNCGVCGHKCESRSCDKGVCNPPPCAPTLTRCGPACVQTAADPRHCGGCDQPCGDKAPLCVLGKCVQRQTNLPPSKPDAVVPGEPPPRDGGAVAQPPRDADDGAPPPDARAPAPK